MNLEVNVSYLESEITVLSSKLDECRQVVQEMASAFEGDGIADMRRDMEQMFIQIGQLQRAVSDAPIIAHDPIARLRNPEPKAYGGAHDAKEIENFLAANVEDEIRKVSTATMYLMGDAKLWWRTKYAEIQAYLVRLDTPGPFSGGDPRAVLPGESNIRDMSENDKLFTFMEGLILWARLELQRQRVTNLSSAIVAAERLTDFNPEGRRDRQTTPGPAQN
ncbi:UNVERIFIED_CONTAM: hypothetical protein Sindi_0656700 [Sesamum indicum]